MSPRIPQIEKDAPQRATGVEVGYSSDRPTVSVVIVNYNVRDFLSQALRSLERSAEGLDVEIFVVDNNSVDGSVDMVLRDFPHVRLIRNDRNVGFSRANNQAIRQAAGQYLFILNPDTILQEDTLRVMVDHLDEHPECGAVGCQILNPDGSFAPESRRAFPTPRVAFYRISGLSRLFPQSPVFGRYNMTFLPRDEEAEVDALSGSCMMVRHAALLTSLSTWQSLDEEHRSDIAHGRVPADDSFATDGAGLFDEDFFMYGEDLDWCYRIQQAGWTIRYTPHTRIIHYKGESTKKGELRYVRLFYGAMLRFIEKHFRSRYSRVFALMLRAGIMGRAALTLAGTGLRRSRAAIIDFLIVFACVSVVGLVRSWLADAEFNLSFLGTVAPAYALAVVAGTAFAGGYRRSKRYSARPVVTGAIVGLLVVSAGSFFVKDIAFSRAVVATSFVLILTLLSLKRWLGRGAATDSRRALLVGSRSEAQRLHRMLSRHPAPPFRLEGYVDPESKKYRRGGGALASLGTLNQLRDLVRLQRIDDVVFAADGLSNASTFTVMQQLKDLPVQFRMLVEGREHVIGKASVEDLTLPALVEVEDTIGEGRSELGRRAFELSIAIPTLILLPLLWTLAALSPKDSYLRRVVSRARLLPSVVTGRLGLVGYRDAGDAELAERVGLRPAVFGVAETWGPGRPSSDELSRAYCFYARHQSASLDCSIMLRSLNNRR